MNNLLRAISFVADNGVVHEDMRNFTSFMNMIVEFMKVEFTVMGFTFSYWQILVLVCLASVIGWFIGNVFS